MTAVSARTDMLAPAEFRVGRVFSRSIGILSRHFGKFFLLTAIATAPSLILLVIGLSSFKPTVGPTGVPNISGAMIAAVVGGGLLWVVLYLLSQAVVLYGAFQDMRGKPFSIGVSLKWGLARLLPIIGLSICMVVAIGIGSILLVVPGFIVLSMLYVSLPVCVVEKLGAFESMGRSAALTKGYRWRIFGIYLLLTLIVGIIGGVVQVAAGVVVHLAAVGAIGSIIAGVVNFAWNALAGAFQAVVAVVAYHDLRVMKEGVDVEQIAAVFD
jgi:hypothetical protein